MRHPSDHDGTSCIVIRPIADHPSPGIIQCHVYPAVVDAKFESHVSGSAQPNSTGSEGKLINPRAGMGLANVCSRRQDTELANCRSSGQIHDLFGKNSASENDHRTQKGPGGYLSATEIWIDPRFGVKGTRVTECGRAIDGVELEEHPDKIQGDGDILIAAVDHVAPCGSDGKHQGGRNEEIVFH